MACPSWPWFYRLQARALPEHCKSTFSDEHIRGFAADPPSSKPILLGSLIANNSSLYLKSASVTARSVAGGGVGDCCSIGVEGPWATVSWKGMNEAAARANIQIMFPFRFIRNVFVNTFTFTLSCINEFFEKTITALVFTYPSRCDMSRYPLNACRLAGIKVYTTDLSSFIVI